MIYFVPDRLIPERFSGISRRYLNECISLTILLLFGIICAWTVGDATDGLLPEPLEKIRKLLHGGATMCPLCGGTRGFIFMCRGEIIMAAHYNFFSVLFFFALFVHLFFKIWALCSDRLPGIPAKILAMIDCNWLILVIIFVLWIIQMILHFTGIFLWRMAL